MSSSVPPLVIRLAAMAGGALMLAWPWVLLPPVTALLCLSWLWTRPEQ